MRIKFAYINIASSIIVIMIQKKSRPKSKWTDVKSKKIAYDKGKYEVAVVRDENNENFEIVVIRQWLTDGQGNSTIKNKAGKEIPKRVFVIPTNKDLLQQIGKSLQEILEETN